MYKYLIIEHNYIYIFLNFNYEEETSASLWK